MERPGHKYIKRENLGNGKYRYIYEQSQGKKAPSEKDTIQMVEDFKSALSQDKQYKRYAKYFDRSDYTNATQAISARGEDVTPESFIQELGNITQVLGTKVSPYLPVAVAAKEYKQMFNMAGSRTTEYNKKLTDAIGQQQLSGATKTDANLSRLKAAGINEQQLNESRKNPRKIKELMDRLRERFLAAYDKLHRIEREGDAKAILVVDEQEYPIPFPLVKGTKGWKFDAEAGAEELVNRRIGENELFAIKSCLAFGDAQREYAEADRDGDGLIEYAQKFRSNDGKRDGLFWPTKEGAPLSPLGPLAAHVRSEGYSAKDASPAPLHGYYYRILTGQGKDAPGGAYDYMVNDNLIGGYALVAYPARWGASGVMTFICNHDGVVDQKNFGEDTIDLASKMTHYNPGRDLAEGRVGASFY